MKEDMYLRIKQVTARTGLSRATIYGMMRIGTFPMKTALGVRAVGWLSSEIQHWMLERKTAEKEGHEASPGRKSSKAIGTSAAGKIGHATLHPVPEPRQVEVAKSKDEVIDWEDDSSSPSADEMNVIRSRLKLNNKKRQGDIVPVKRSSKPLIIGLRQLEPGRSGPVKVISSKSVKLK